ncbi:MAG: hypothetical protein IKN57_10785, partial [Parasporobacterium sp.]|nr:hypothetical protein [Parasporobacterium sp.]
MRRTYQNLVLLVASLVFYAWGEPHFIFILLASIVLNWLIGLGLGKTEVLFKRRLLLAAALVLDLGILFVFKYLGFVAGWFGKTVSIALPLGVSFYTFQILSYVLDVYYNSKKVQKNLAWLGLYISMFPQLVAGPIVRYSDVSEELLNRQTTSADVTEGVRRFVYGLGKKVLGCYDQGTSRLCGGIDILDRNIKIKGSLIGKDLLLIKSEKAHKILNEVDDGTMG